MFCLTATGAQQPDYVALAMVLVLALIVAVMALKKYLSKKNSGPAHVAAYSYMALVPVIQPPVIKLLTTKLVNFLFSE